MNSPRGSVVVTPGSIAVSTGSIAVTPGSVVVTTGSVVVTPGSIVDTTGSVVVTPGATVELSPTSYLDVRAVRHNLLRGGNLALGMSSLRLNGGGMNSEDGSGVVLIDVDDEWNGSGDDGSAGAAKHLARRSSAEGGDSEISGDGGGGGKARSSQLLSEGKRLIGIGASGRIAILAVCRVG
ncbi:hypothetical protein Tco_0321729 [Tanacetum coccineum]